MSGRGSGIEDGASEDATTRRVGQAGLGDLDIELELQNEELQTALTQLEDVRERYDELFELAPVGYLTLEQTGTIREANTMASQLIGIERARLLGRALQSFMPTESADRFYLHLRETFSRPGKQAFEGMLTTADGNRAVHIDSLAAPCTGGEVVCRAAITDVTELRRIEGRHTASEQRLLIAEAEVQHSETRFRQIAEHIEDAIIVVERQTRQVSYASPVNEKIWLRPLSELESTGIPWMSWVHREDKTVVSAAYLAYLKGDPFDVEHRVCRPSGEMRWVRARMFSVEDERGLPLRDVCLVQDITGERSLQEELRQTQKMEAVGALASGVAHDFNNVLQAILGCLTLARDEGIDSERAKMFLERAHHAVLRGGDLAGQLMAFAYKRNSVPKPIAVDRVIQGIGKLLERLVTEQIELVIDTNAPDARVLAETVQLEQILMNLVSNARDAVRENGKVVIRTELVEAESDQPHSHMLRLSVRDTGVGMDQATMQRIFEPFFTTKEVGKGTGLGLATVFTLTKQLDGHVHVDSEPGEGACFTITLPCCENGAAATRFSSTLPALSLSGTALLVEDDDIVRLSLRHYLEEMGLNVLDAADPRQAMELCERFGGTLDLLVSDVILPVMTGPKLAAQLEQRYPGLRVLFVSANADIAAEQEANATAVNLLPKPFSRDELIQAMANIMSDGAEDSPEGRDVERQ